MKAERQKERLNNKPTKDDTSTFTQADRGDVPV